MSDVVPLFQIALPALFLLALSVSVVIGVALLIRLLGGGLPAQRPRIVSTRPKRDLTRQR